MSPATPPELLFISPVQPSPGGGGPPMRAFHIMQALSKENRVHLLVCEAFGTGGGAEIDERLQDTCASVNRVSTGVLANLVLRMRRFIRDRFTCLHLRTAPEPLEYSSARMASQSSAIPISGQRFDRIFVFRIYLFPLTSLFRQRSENSSIYLDLDDIESITRSRISALYRDSGKKCESLLSERESAFYERLEERVLPLCSRVFVASELDQRTLAERNGTETLSLLPNVYPVQPQTPDSLSGPVFSFLFVGSLGYFPNYQAVAWLCRSVIPRLEKMTSKRFLFRIVGGGADARLERLVRSTPKVELAGWVEDIKEAYANIDAVVSPIHAGGGTRIKILEAFAFGKPVVSTTLGAEGIDCTGGVHLLLADQAGTFAHQCIQLIESPDLRQKLTVAARELQHRRYSPEALARVLAEL